MATSSSPRHSEDAAASAAVCCMCGDHGLPRELFRCRSCRARLQHSYCSDLYPRATAYRRCNWCLREPPAPLPAQAGVVAAGHTAGTAAHGNNKPAAETKRKAATTAASNEERHLQRRHGCSRPPSELGYPAKKKKRKAADERAQPPDAGVEGSRSNAGERKEMMRAGKARVVKMQRYKLLAEVISC